MDYLITSMHIAQFSGHGLKAGTMSVSGLDLHTAPIGITPIQQIKFSKISKGT